MDSLTAFIDWIPQTRTALGFSRGNNTVSRYYCCLWYTDENHGDKRTCLVPDSTSGTDPGGRLWQSHSSWAQEPRNHSPASQVHQPQQELSFCLGSILHIWISSLARTFSQSLALKVVNHFPRAGLFNLIIYMWSQQREDWMLVYPIDRGEGKESKMVQCSQQRRKQCCEGKGSDTRSRQPSLRLSLECRGTYLHTQTSLRQEEPVQEACPQVRSFPVWIFSFPTRCERVLQTIDGCIPCHFPPIAAQQVKTRSVTDSILVTDSWGDSGFHTHNQNWSLADVGSKSQNSSCASFSLCLSIFRADILLFERGLDGRENTCGCIQEYFREARWEGLHEVRQCIVSEICWSLGSQSSLPLMMNI